MIVGSRNAVRQTAATLSSAVAPLVWALFATLGAGLPSMTALADDGPQASESAVSGDSDEANERDALRLEGRVVFLADSLRKDYGVKTVADARENILALQAGDGTLYPLVEDVRGRAFRRDERLRDMQVELLVRRYEGVPLVQIIRVYELAEDGKYELDYWCDICAIAMFELKPCDCCQGDIELRRRKVR